MKWNRAGALATPLALCLLAAGCGSADPAPAPTAALATGAQAAGEGEPDLPPVMGPERRIVALGDSLFAGYGLSPGQSYPARLETALRGRGINARIMNAGVSGDTTSGGLQRIDFTLGSNPQPTALVIISLGGNDMLRGVPPEETRANLEAILAKLKDRKIPVLMLGMIAAPNMGGDFSGRFNPIYPALAQKYGAGLVPFFLQPLLGKPDLVQADRIHPTAPGIDLMVADTIDDVVKALPAAAPTPR